MLPITALPERIRVKIGTPDDCGCWPWLASLRDGYGQIAVRSESGARSVRSAHRVIYEMLVGDVPAELDLDHLCRNRACVNPAHLEPVTRRENLLRSEITFASINAAKVTCLRGHALIRSASTGNRFCPTCRRDQRAERQAQAA